MARPLRAMAGPAAASGALDSMALVLGARGGMNSESRALLPSAVACAAPHAAPYDAGSCWDAIAPLALERCGCN